MTEPNAMSCETFEQQVASYLAGRLPDAEAERLEWHAANCATCEVRLEHASRLSMPLIADVTDPMRRQMLESLALESAHSSTTLNTVPTDFRSRSHGRKFRSWRTAAVVFATAAALVVVVTRRQPVSTDGIADATSVAATDDSGASMTSTLVMQGSGMQRVAAQLARDEASEEFLALDAATEELEAALERTPSDRELRTYLNTVRARRDELSRRVREATS